MFCHWRCCLFLTIAAILVDPQQQVSIEAVSSQPRILAAQLTQRSEQESEADEALDECLALIKSGRLEEAETALLRYVQDHPPSSRAYYQLGFVYFRRQNYPGSIEALQKSIALGSANADAHKILGLDFVLGGNYEAAERELQAAARLAPESVEIRYFLGRLYYTKGVYPLAQAEFEQVIRMDPANARAYDNLGLALEGSGDESAAEINYQKAAALVDVKRLSYEWPYINLSALCNRQNRPQAAADYARKAVGMNPHSAQAYFQLGKAYRQLEDWGPAADALERTTELDPGSAQAYYVLSYVYRRLGKSRESRDSLVKFEQLEANGSGKAREVHATPLRDAKVRE